MRIGSLAGGVLMVGLFAGVAAAQTPAPAAPAATPEPAAPAKRFTFTTGMDVVSAYMFRGIRQESDGFIGQPYVDLGVALGSGATLNVGNWDSLHSTNPSGFGSFYESDYYASLTFTAGKVKPGLLYTSYTSPADRFATVHELAGVLAIDDSARPVPMSPKIVLAFELGDGQADGGSGKGTYLELGVKPAVKLAPKLTLFIPVKMGLSLNNYYEGPAGDSAFGFFDTGFSLSVPVASGKNGTFELHGGLDLLWLGETTKYLNLDKGFRPVTLVGFTYSY